MMIYVLQKLGFAGALPILRMMPLFTCTARDRNGQQRIATVGWVEATAETHQTGQRMQWVSLALYPSCE